MYIIEHLSGKAQKGEKYSVMTFMEAKISVYNKDEFETGEQGRIEQQTDETRERQCCEASTGIEVRREEKTFDRQQSFQLTMKDKEKENKKGISSNAKMVKEDTPKKLKRAFKTCWKEKTKSKKTRRAYQAT